MGNPNIVLIIVDCLRPDRLPCYGADTNPQFFVQFAQNSQQYERCLSVAPWTLVSVASILTGVNPDIHGLTNHNLSIGANCPTLAERLAEQGYRTAAFVENKNLQPYFGFARGFQVFHNEYLHTVEEHPTEDTIQISGNAGTLESNDHTKIFDLADEFLSEVRKSKEPYFLLFHTNGVHDFYLDYPYYKTGEAKFSAGVDHTSIKSYPFWQAISADEIIALQGRYDQGLEFTANGLNRLMQHIDLNNTAVVVMSDHGEGFEPDAHRYHHCGRLHNDLLHVPLMISTPDGRTQPNLESLVSTLDIAPTLLQIAGVDTGVGLHGLEGYSLFDPHPTRQLSAVEKAYVYFSQFKSRLPEKWFEKEKDNWERCRLTYKSHVPFGITATIDNGKKTITTRIGDRVFVEVYDLEKDFKEKIQFIPEVVKGNHAGKKIYFGADHNVSPEIHQGVVDFLRTRFGNIVDITAGNYDANYIDASIDVVKKLDEHSAGILMCGNGMGVSIVVNRFDNMEGARCITVEDAEDSRRVNNSNVLCVGGKLRLETIEKIIEAWVTTSYDGRNIMNLKRIQKLRR